MHVNGPFFDEDVVAPHTVGQLSPAVHSFRVPHEEVKQAELGRADLDLEGDFTRAPRHASGSRIQLKPTCDHGRFQQVRGPAPQHGADARQQLLYREGLGQVIVCTSVKPGNLVSFVRASRQHNNRHAARACIRSPAA